MSLRKILCTFSGDDYGIISVCSRRTQNRFTAIGTFVLLIFILCFVSCFFTFTKLFQSYFIGIPAGLFFAFMITNIYLLLLYTLTDNVLPHVQRRAGKIISTAFRLLFIWFIAIVVSKPIEMLVFSSWINDEIAVFKQIQLSQFRESTDKYFDSEISQLRDQVEKQRQLFDEPSAAELSKYELLIQKKETQRTELINRMAELVNHSNYYIRSIVLLNEKYPFCWLITLLVVAIFTIPSYLKEFIPLTGIFYGRKKDIEMQLIKREYESFKATYSELFRAIYNAEIKYSEVFEDAPFNLTRKIDNRIALSEESLIAELYNA